MWNLFSVLFSLSLFKWSPPFCYHLQEFVWHAHLSCTCLPLGHCAVLFSKYGTFRHADKQSRLNYTYKNDTVYYEHSYTTSIHHLKMQ